MYYTGTKERHGVIVIVHSVIVIVTDKIGVIVIVIEKHTM